MSDATDYVECQLKIIKRWADEQDVHSRGMRNDPATAFVVMPFGESWSDQIYAFISRAVATLDGRAVAIRADEIAKPGRITDQIIGAYRCCGRRYR